MMESVFGAEMFFKSLTRLWSLSWFLLFDFRGLGLEFLRAGWCTHLVGLSHCVVRVMWFKYWMRPDAVLLSSQLPAEINTGTAVSGHSQQPHKHAAVFPSLEGQTSSKYQLFPPRN